MAKHFCYRVYYAPSRDVLKRNCKLTSKHYFVAESLFCLQWDVVLQDVILNKKKRGINIYDQLIIFMIKSTPMNLDNVLVRINKLLFVAPSHISNIADIIHRTSSFWEKKNSSFESTFFSISSPLLRKLKFLRFFRLSCNDNNYMTYNWPNSAFFNFQEHAKQENCRQYLCILFFFFWEIRTKNPTKTKFIVEPSFFTSWTIRSEKCSWAQVQENKSIYLSIYLSIWKPFWKRVYIYIYIYPFSKRFSYREMYI